MNYRILSGLMMLSIQAISITRIEAIFKMLAALMGSVASLFTFRILCTAQSVVTKLFV